MIRRISSSFSGGEVLAFCKGGEEVGNRIRKAFFHYLVHGGKLRLLLGDKGGDDGVVILHHTPLDESAQDGVGGGFGPADLFPGKAAPALCF